MPDVKINVVADVGQANTNLKQLDQTMTGMEGTSKDAGLSLTDLKSGLDLATAGFKAVQSAVKSVIDPVVDYSKNIRDLSSFTGISAEESSKLINVADDLQVEYGTLRTASRKLIEDGLQPNIETLADLSDEYLNIQDPVERSQFLIETFGSRAGPEMARLLEQGGDALRGMAAEAENIGLVMDEEGVASARRYEMAMDDFEDSVLSAKIALAENLLPALSDTVSTGADFIQYWKNSTQAILDGRLSLLDWQKNGYEVIFTGATLADVNAELTASYTDQQAAIEAVDPAVQNLRLAAEAVTTATNDQALAVEADTARWQGLADMYNNQTTPAAYGYLAAADLLKEGLSGLTEQLIFNKAATNLSDEAALQLGISMGLVDTRVLALNEALPALKEKYDANHDGTISAAESTAGYAAAVQALTDALLAVPANVTSTVTTNFVTNGTPSGGGAVPAGPPGYTNDDARAGGGPVSGGHPYLVGENGPEPFFPASDGYVMNNTDMRDMLDALKAIARGGGGNTYVVNGTYANQDGGTVAQELRLMSQLYG